MCVWQPLNADKAEVTLTIDVLDDQHFTSYYLSAENDIDVADVKMVLKRGSKDTEPEPEPVGPGEANPGYSHSNQGAAG